MKHQFNTIILYFAKSTTERGPVTGSTRQNSFRKALALDYLQIGT